MGLTGFFNRPKIKKYLGWGTTFRDLTMPVFEVPKIDVLGGGPVFETSRCHFLESQKSIVWVGDHFSRPHDAIFLRPKNRFLGGGPLFEALRCQFVKAGKSMFWVGDHFSRPHGANLFSPKNVFFWWGTTFSRHYDANVLRPGNRCVGWVTTFRECRRHAFLTVPAVWFF